MRGSFGGTGEIGGGSATGIRAGLTPTATPTSVSSLGGSFGRIRIGGRNVTIALQPISDPLAHVVGLLHKLVFATHVPHAGSVRDGRRVALERFWRHVFFFRAYAGTIKDRLVKLANRSPDVVDLPDLRHPGVGERGGGHRLTYQELHAMLDEVVAEYGFDEHVHRAVMDQPT